MGVPDSQYRFVFDNTNVILGAGDPEYVAEGTDLLTAVLTAGGNLAELMNEVIEAKRGGDGTDLTSQLGQRRPRRRELTTPTWPASSSSWWWPATRRPAMRSAGVSSI